QPGHTAGGGYGDALARAGQGRHAAHDQRGRGPLAGAPAALMTRVLLGLLTAYKYAISPLLGRSCRFYPSCSEYAREAVELYGPWRGTCLAGGRVGRRQPFPPVGYEPVSWPTQNRQ